LTEKRKVERFDLQIETIVQIQDESGMDRTQRLFTRDISSNGVFLKSNNPLPIGTMIDLNFLLSLNELNVDSANKAVTINTSGIIIRTEEQGFAVQFDKQHIVSEFK
jgi:hypothetical protein